MLNALNRLDDAMLTRPGPDLAGEVAIQIKLAIVQLYQQDPESALDQLRSAAAKASTAGDASGHAHALELSGVAAWMLRNSPEAKKCWENAGELYAEAGEVEGQARCLQHLGSVAVVERKFDRALELLELSAELRGGEDGYPTLAEYLEAARGSSTPQPADDSPVRTPRHWIRRLVSRWFG